MARELIPWTAIVAWLCVAGAGACAAPAPPAAVAAAPPPASTPAATTPPAPAPPATSSPEAETAKAPSPPPEAEREGPTAGLHLHRRDVSGLRPDDVVSGSGTAPSVPGPSVEMGAVSGVRDVDNAARVIAAMRAGFRRCYQRALEVDQTMTGVFGLEAKVGPNGEVTAVTVKGQKGVPADLAACLNAIFRHAQFAAPQGGSATLSVPFTITRQQ